ncbi:MAG: hypothetical protein ABUL72_06200, partial [Armatimonadota bacterium]
EKSPGETLRLHFFSHSQGGTITHDVLFALFNTVRPRECFTDTVDPTEGHTEKTISEVKRLRALSDAGRLVLGSMNTVGNQISLNFMRSQNLVDRFFNGQFIDPTQLGIPTEGPVVWNNFYDRDDVLGYPLRGLYGYPSSIAEYEVESGLLIKAHTNYWQVSDVIKQAAKLIASRIE